MSRHIFLLVTLAVLAIGITVYKARQNNISVRIIAVLQQSGPQLQWKDEKGMLQLTKWEKDEIRQNGITGDLETVYTTGRGSAATEVRIVIILRSPLSRNADYDLKVPKSGSVIYIQTDSGLKLVSGDFVPSALQLKIIQERNDTEFQIDMPAEGVESGGEIFWWDDAGKFHNL
jgi:hypothetical protein